ncbi:MAG: T9SS type A sorting domain-containing protein, partial [Bacteroidota bacterium]
NHRDNYEGAWGVYPFLPSGNILVSDMQEGLFVLKGMEDNCQATASSIKCTSATTSTEDNIAESDLKIYPQPASSVLTLELASTEHIELIRLFNMQGKLVQTWNRDEKSNKIELILNSSLSNGIYNLVINQKSFKRVIITK